MILKSRLARALIHFTYERDSLAKESAHGDVWDRGDLPVWLVKVAPHNSGAARPKYKPIDGGCQLLAQFVLSIDSFCLKLFLNKRDLKRALMGVQM